VLTRQVKLQGNLAKRSVAIKRLSNSHIIEDGPFNHEAKSLIDVNHPNIVRFLGYCANTEKKAVQIESGGNKTVVFADIKERLLCFEYMNNGSLDRYITGMRTHG
jgi:coatomer subunit beta'